jgi:hypothetical protein
MGSLLVCDWLHSVGQNHFYVMMFFIQGCCFIRSLHFSFVLQRRLRAEFKAVSTVPLQPAGWRIIPSGRSTVQASSIRMTRTFHPDLPLCREASNYSKLHLSGGLSNTSRHRPVVNHLWDFFSKTQIWEDNRNRPGNVYSRPDALIYKARCIQNSDVQTLVFMVRRLKLLIWKLSASYQPSGRQLLWSGRAKPWYENCVQLKCDRPDAAQFRKEFQWIWKADHIVVRLDALCLPSGQRLGKPNKMPFRSSVAYK